MLFVYIGPEMFEQQQVEPLLNDECTEKKIHLFLICDSNADCVVICARMSDLFERSTVQRSALNMYSQSKYSLHIKTIDAIDTLAQHLNIQTAFIQ